MTNTRRRIPLRTGGHRSPKGKRQVLQELDSHPELPIRPKAIPPDDYDDITPDNEGMRAWPAIHTLLDEGKNVQEIVKIMRRRLKSTPLELKREIEQAIRFRRLFPARRVFELLGLETQEAQNDKTRDNGDHGPEDPADHHECV